MKKLEYKINEDIIVKDYIKKNISKKFYRYLKKCNFKIYINDKEGYNYSLLKKDDILILEYTDLNLDIKNTYNMDLDILYEDEFIIIIYKPKGLKTIPTGYNDFKSLYNAILYYYQINNINKTIHFINRLDKDTEGLLLVCKDKLTANIFSKNINNINRYYLAIVKGELTGEGIIDFKIKDTSSIKRIISSDGKESITHYRFIKKIDNNSLIELKLETGRTHQIRLHLSSINHPIIGDPIYGDGNDLHLASYRIKFINPVDNKNIDIIKYPSWGDLNG